MGGAWINYGNPIVAVPYPLQGTQSQPSSATGSSWLLAAIDNNVLKMVEFQVVVINGTAFTYATAARYSPNPPGNPFDTGYATFVSESWASSTSVPLADCATCSGYAVSTLSLSELNIDLFYIPNAPGIIIGPTLVPASQIRLGYYDAQQTFLGGAGINGGTPNGCIPFPSTTRNATDTAAYWILAIPPGYPNSVDQASTSTITQMVEVMIVVLDGMAYASSVAARWAIQHYCVLSIFQGKGKHFCPPVPSRPGTAMQGGILYSYMSQRSHTHIYLGQAPEWHRVLSIPRACCCPCSKSPPSRPPQVHR